MQFHLKIAEITGNPLIKLLVGALLSTLKVVYPEPRQTKSFVKCVYERHLGLIDALERKDTKRCKKLIMEDVSYTERLQNLKSIAE